MKADISKSLFLDLAFIIIAALVLLVKDPDLILVEEPLEEEIIIKVLPVERANTKVYQDFDMVGQSLKLHIGEEGARVFDGGETNNIELNELEQRLKEMSQEGDRVVVMQMEEDTDYVTFTRWRNSLIKFKKQGLVDGIVEKRL